MFKYIMHVMHVFDVIVPKTRWTYDRRLLQDIAARTCPARSPAAIARNERDKIDKYVVGLFYFSKFYLRANGQRPSVRICNNML